jgi:hypothetical protein
MSSPTEKRETMTSAEHCALAQRLNDATRDGRLVDAYRVLSELEPGDAELVALRAGFSVITKKNRREFFKHIQQQLADAAQARLDGYGLNAAPFPSEMAPASQLLNDLRVPAMQIEVGAKTGTPKLSP